MKQTYPSHMEKQFKKTTKNFLFVFVLLIIGSLSAQTTLKDAAAAKGKYIGTILNINYFEDNGQNETQYIPTVQQEFNAVVAENNHKSFLLLKSTAQNDLLNVDINDINTQYLDNLMDFGTANNTVVRGHALIWHNGTPSWFENIAYTWNDAQIKQFATNYITAILTYCRDYNGGEFLEWDVINEIINDNDPADYRLTYMPEQNVTRDVWFKNAATSNGGLGIQSFIDHCFTVARPIDSEIKLFYNDYNIEFNGNTKTNFMLTMVQDMIDRNIPIDGVGLQGHFVSGSVLNVNSVEQTINAVGALKPGLICNITELDLRICGSGSNSEIQAQNYYDILDMAMNNQYTTGLMFWGFTDQHSWIPSAFPGCNNALLFNTSYNKKRSYLGALNGTLGIPLPPPPVVEQSPFNGTPVTIATTGQSTINFAEFDNGGQGVAYNDTTPGQEPGGNGSGDVDTFGGNVVGYVEVGEWLEYTVDVEAAGIYDLVFTTASTDDAAAELTVGGANIIQGGTTVAFPQTGAFDVYQTTTPSQVQFAAGEQILRVFFTQTPLNLDEMTFSLNILSTTSFTTADNLQLYPNPFDEELTLSFKGIENAKTFELLDLNGRVVYIQEHTGAREAKLSPSAVQSGLYFLKAVMNTGVEKTVRVVKN